MSLVFTRQLHSKRLPNYNGWWTQILKQATNPIEQSMQEQQPTTTTTLERKVPLPIPFADVIEPTQPIITHANKPKVLVHLRGKPIELPEKPDPPENCCMSVWDMYQEDMEEYAARKKEIKNQFLDAGEPLPRELDPSNAADDAAEDMDPTMKAFLEMEKKLNSK
ncbi:hypothetical protein MBANPS3_006224 [Mucor bainieri]